MTARTPPARPRMLHHMPGGRWWTATAMMAAAIVAEGEWVAAECASPGSASTSAGRLRDVGVSARSDGAVLYAFWDGTLLPGMGPRA